MQLSIKVVSIDRMPAAVREFFRQYLGAEPVVVAEGDESLCVMFPSSISVGEKTVHCTDDEIFEMLEGSKDKAGTKKTAEHLLMCPACRRNKEGFKRNLEFLEVCGVIKERPAS